MKATKDGLGRSLDRPDPAVRLYLLHGPDDGQSRALGERLLKGLGASRFVVSASAIKSDTALLADEAGAMSLFGGPRAIWIEPAGDDIAEGAGTLLAAAASESPVIAIAGPLRKSSALLKLAESHPRALAHASYIPEGRDADRMVMDVGRTYGLRIPQAVATRIAEACGGDQAVVTQECAKIALFLDASPEAPKDVDHDSVDAIGAALPGGDFLKFPDLALGGRIDQLANELARLSPAGTEGIPMVRALQRRLLMLAPLRARIERGESVDAVMASMGKALFWKDKSLVKTLLSNWDALSLETLFDRAARTERQLIFSPAPAAETLGEELVAIARAARRR